MLAYRYIPYVNPKEPTPTFSLVSFEHAYDLSRMRAISLDWIEQTWNEKSSIVFVLHYCDSDIYYFILPSTIDCPNTSEYRRMKLEEGRDAHDHHCDYYAKDILRSFVGQFSKRLHTRYIIQRIESTIPFDPTDITYHQIMWNQLELIEIDETHDQSLLERIIADTREIVETEQRYRPNGAGMEEAKQDFEELALLTKK
jgi:hypothetical protein